MMAKQTVEIDVPEGFETTGATSSIWSDPPGLTLGFHVGIRRKEPLAIQACRKLVEYRESMRSADASFNPMFNDAVVLSRQAIADFEKGGAK
jgi:hypothetical protein